MRCKSLLARWSHSPVHLLHTRVQKSVFSSTRRRLRLLGKGVLFQHQSPLRVQNCRDFNSTQSVSNCYYQVRLKYTIQKINIFVKMLELFCCFPLLFALIWTSPDCVLYNNQFVLRKTLGVSFTPLGYQIPGHAS